MTDPLEARLKELEHQIETSCRRAGRNPSDVRVLLATKRVSPERLQIALKNNYALFGENTAQELVKKQSALSDQDIEWHFIGRLQTNKVKDILPRVTLIHSLDRWNLALEIQKRATRPVNVLIEIHSSGEATKAGIAPTELAEFALKLKDLDKIRIQGVMTLAENASSETTVRECFRRTRQCFEDLKQLDLPHCDLKYISMGMSNDYPIAIEEGANMIRVGSAVFGDRY